MKTMTVGELKARFSEVLDMVMDFTKIHSIECLHGKQSITN